VRSPREIAFRLRQELGNLRLWWWPLSLPAVPLSPKLRPAIERLQGTAHAAETIRLADEILHHRFPIFGGILETGPEIRWRRDYVHQIETGTPYFRRVPYLDFARVGDHKYIWELNRHQHLVVLAQAYCLTGRAEYLWEAQTQVSHWLAENPPLRGINWTSALEVAFRALSWVWLDALAGVSLPQDFRRGFCNALYLHGCFLERNLSVYFSPNTHLLGEAVALHTLSVLYPELPLSHRWRTLASELVEEQMVRQVREDGSHFEQSTYYHVYALDMFLWHELLAETSARYKDKLLRMAEYLAALLGPGETLPLIGDDDGGRLFHPYGKRAGFARATLAATGALAVKPVSRANRSRQFPDAGMAVMTAGDIQIIVKAGAFGPGSAGHSHSDALSFVCRLGDHWWLVDSGTYSYLDPEWRNRFRGSAAHNTIRIDGKDQATPAGPFRWAHLPEVRSLEWSSTEEQDSLDAECRYSGFVHLRRFLFLKPYVLFVLDRVEGQPGEHLVEQFWHAAQTDKFTSMAFSHESAATETWHSEVFGSKHAVPGRLVTYRGSLPVTLAAAISFQAPPEHLEIEGKTEQTTLALRLHSGTTLRARFS
jgi:Heparinase II/III-like protein/Heparinase II/III N-terminus